MSRTHFSTHPALTTPHFHLERWFPRSGVPPGCKNDPFPKPFLYWFQVACTQKSRFVSRSVGPSVADSSEHATYGDRPCFLPCLASWLSTECGLVGISSTKAFLPVISDHCLNQFTNKTLKTHVFFSYYFASACSVGPRQNVSNAS